MHSTTPKDTRNILKEHPGEPSLDELKVSFIHDHSAPELEPLSLPMRTVPEDFINEVSVTVLLTETVLRP